MPDAKLLDIPRYWESERFSERERLALTYADRMTVTSDDVDDELFARVRSMYSAEEIVELTATVALENLLSKMHRALRVDSQGFCPLPPMAADGGAAAEGGAPAADGGAAKAVPGAP